MFHVDEPPTNPRLKVSRRPATSAAGSLRRSYVMGAHQVLRGPLVAMISYSTVSSSVGSSNPPPRHLRHLRRQERSPTCQPLQTRRRLARWRTQKQRPRQRKRAHPSRRRRQPRIAAAGTVAVVAEGAYRKAEEKGNPGRRWHARR